MWAGFRRYFDEKSFWLSKDGAALGIPAEELSISGVHSESRGKVEGGVSCEVG